MKYRVEYQSAIDDEIKVAIIEAASEQSATRKLVEDRDKYPRRIISCRRIDDNMKKYKIGNRVITADSPTKALEIHKLLDNKVKDVYNPKLNQVKFKAYESDFDSPEELMHYAKMICGDLTADDKKFLENLISEVWLINYKIKDSVNDYKIVQAKDLEEGMILTMKEDDSKWRISQVRKGPFGLTLRINSVESPVKTREITVPNSYGAMVDSTKDAEYSDRTKQGWKIIEKYKDGNRTHAIAKRSYDFIICLGYNENDGTWDQGMYDYESADEARKALRKEKPGARLTYDSVKDDTKKVNGMNILQYVEFLMRKYKMSEDDAWKEADIAFGINDSIKDDDSSDIDKLSKEEEQAIADYKEAIAKTNDVKLLKLFAHILKEETEHLEELESEEIEDSMEDAPDDQSYSGRREIALQKAMAALNVIPSNKWNRQGYKIDVDNNRIVLICSSDGSVIWKNYKGGSKDMPFTNSDALKEALKNERL